MTSIPASRSARAMTLAPRSWPSNPGLAISTRIFFSGIVALLPLLCALCVLCVERRLVAIGGHDESANAIFQDRHIEIDSAVQAGARRVADKSILLLRGSGQDHQPI